MSSVRDRLRADTTAAHHALDTIVACFDVSTSAGLGRFLLMHERAMAAVAVTSPPSVTHYDLKGHQGRVQADLDTLCTPRDCMAPYDLRATEPLASAYILCGAHMGAHVLRQHWLKSNDSLTRRAGTFLTHASQPHGWQQLRADLIKINATSHHADIIVRDSLAIFDMYRAVALEVRDMEWCGNGK